MHKDEDIVPLNEEMIEKNANLFLKGHEIGIFQLGCIKMLLHKENHTWHFRMAEAIKKRVIEKNDYWEYNIVIDNHESNVSIHPSLSHRNRNKPMEKKGGKIIAKDGSEIEFKKILAEEYARKVFLDYSDCHQMQIIVESVIDQPPPFIPAMSEEKFVEIVGKIIYSTKDLVEKEK